MRMVARLLCYFTLACWSSQCVQGAAEGNWGSWRYTWQDTEERPEYWSGIPFRSKCTSLDNDSKWDYQFRSRYDRTMDFVERVEHKVTDATTNEFDRPEVVVLKGGEISPVYKTELHGTCEELKELKIEVICVTEHERGGRDNDSCFRNKDGDLLEYKKAE